MPVEPIAKDVILGILQATGDQTGEVIQTIEGGIGHPAPRQLCTQEEVLRRRIIGEDSEPDEGRRQENPG